jgi:hypothetical protein
MNTPFILRLSIVSKPGPYCQGPRNLSPHSGVSPISSSTQPCAFTVIVDRMFTKPNTSSVLRLTLQLIIVDQESL